MISNKSKHYKKLFSITYSGKGPEKRTTTITRNNVQVKQKKHLKCIQPLLKGCFISLGSSAFYRMFYASSFSTPSVILLFTDRAQCSGPTSSSRLSYHSVLTKSSSLQPGFLRFRVIILFTLGLHKSPLPAHSCSKHSFQHSF